MLRLLFCTAQLLVPAASQSDQWPLCQEYYNVCCLYDRQKSHVPKKLQRCKLKGSFWKVTILHEATCSLFVIYIQTRILPKVREVHLHDCHLGVTKESWSLMIKIRNSGGFWTNSGCNRRKSKYYSFAQRWDRLSVLALLKTGLQNIETAGASETTAPSTWVSAR